MIEIRNYWYPKEDQVFKLRDLLKKMAVSRQQEGQMTSVSEQLFGPEGRVFIVSFLDQDFAAFEARRNNNQTSPEIRSYLTEARELCRMGVCPGSV